MKKLSKVQYRVLSLAAENDEIDTQKFVPLQTLRALRDAGLLETVDKAPHICKWKITEAGRKVLAN